MIRKSFTPPRSRRVNTHPRAVINPSTIQSKNVTSFHTNDTGVVSPPNYEELQSTKLSPRAQPPQTGFSLVVTVWDEQTPGFAAQ